MKRAGLKGASRRPKGVIHHSDQGAQHTCLAFGRRCREAEGEAIHGFGRRRVGQRDVREVHRHPGVRVGRAGAYGTGTTPGARCSTSSKASTRHFGGARCSPMTRQSARRGGVRLRSTTPVQAASSGSRSPGPLPHASEERIHLGHNFQPSTKTGQAIGRLVLEDDLRIAARRLGAASEAIRAFHDHDRERISIAISEDPHHKGDQ